MAAPLTFGPIYCEDAVALAAFPIEPVNTVSNAVIVLFGILAIHAVSRRAPKATDLYVLGIMLVANGIGSGLWHGLREPWALAFDVLPGLVFLFALAFIWARRLWGNGTAGLLLLGFFLAFALSALVLRGVQARWVGIAPAVIVTAAVLISQTAQRSRRAAVLGGAALSSSLIALGFRTVDMAACAYVPFGTHFLWHVFLSAGGFLGIMTLIRMGETEHSRKRALVEEPAQ